MRHNHRRHPHRTHNVLEPRPQLAPHHSVQRPKGLVQQQQARRGSQGTGQGHALPLPA